MNQTEQIDLDEKLLKSRSVEEIEKWLKLGADVDSIDQYGYNSLVYAAIRNNTEAIRILVAAGADVNAKNRHGNSPMIYAAIRNNPEVIEVLVAAGADVNSKNRSGDAPLIKAVGRNNTEAIKVLLKHGADISVTNHEKRKSIHYSRNSLEILQLLVSEGADIEAEDMYGKRLLHYVCGRFFQYDDHDDEEGYGESLSKVLRFLLINGVDYSALDKDGHDARYYARDKPNLIRIFDEIVGPKVPTILESLAVHAN